MLTRRILKMEKKPVNCKIFFCLGCSKGFVLEEEALKCGCNPRFLVQGIFTPHRPNLIKPSRWRRFLSLDFDLIGWLPDHKGWPGNHAYGWDREKESPYLSLILTIHIVNMANCGLKPH